MEVCVTSIYRVGNYGNTLRSCSNLLWLCRLNAQPELAAAVEWIDNWMS